MRSDKYIPVELELSISILLQDVVLVFLVFLFLYCKEADPEHRAQLLAIASRAASFVSAQHEKKTIMNQLMQDLSASQQVRPDLGQQKQMLSIAEQAAAKAVEKETAVRAADMKRREDHIHEEERRHLVL